MEGDDEEEACRTVIAPVSIALVSLRGGSEVIAAAVGALLSVAAVMRSMRSCVAAGLGRSSSRTCAMLGKDSTLSLAWEWRMEASMRDAASERGWSVVGGWGEEPVWSGGVEGMMAMEGCLESLVMLVELVVEV